MRIHLVTPCSRPENLPRLYASIRAHLARADWRWWVVFDDDAAGCVDRIPLIFDARAAFIRVSGGAPAGHRLRNVALDWIDERSPDWVYQLDDDNLVHSAFLEMLEAASDANPLAQVVTIWSQLSVAKGSLPWVQPSALNHRMDNGSFVAQRNAIGALRYHDKYEADQLFFDELAARCTVYYVPAFAAYYNAIGAVPQGSPALNCAPYRPKQKVSTP